MDATIYCLLDERGAVHMKDGAESYSEIAAAHGLDERTCQEYRFDLVNRRLLADRGRPDRDRMAQDYMNRFVGTPEKLVHFAEEGHLPKRVLLNLVTSDKRPAYLEACTAIERAYTKACTATNDPCLASGCAVEDGICLQPLLRAGVEYQQSCAAEWIKLFADSRNRIETWRN